MRKTLRVYSEDERTTSKLRGLIAKINKEFINSPTPFIISRRKKMLRRFGDFTIADDPYSEESNAKKNAALRYRNKVLPKNLANRFKRGK